MKSIDIVNVLLAFVHFSLDPMSVEVSKQMVDIFCRGSVSIPFFNVEGQQGFVDMIARGGNKLIEILVKISNEVVIEVFTKEMCYKRISIQNEFGAA
jgi:hypothetical protein